MITLPTEFVDRMASYSSMLSEEQAKGYDTAVDVVQSAINFYNGPQKDD